MKRLLAFATIYLVWGSTFLAIRIGVQEVPPFLLAALRFVVAGAILYAWAVARGERSPTREHWWGILVVAFFLFLINYGLVFWAQTRVPSGVTAVMMATIPLFMALSEIVILRTRRLTLALVLALGLGIAGVAALVVRSLGLGGDPIDGAGAVALLIGALGWGVGSALMRKLPSPESRVMASATQMLVGGALLGLTAALLGEFGRFHPSAVSRDAWLALVYLIVAGSIVAFTAYVWLLHHESPTKVGTYAYVNPVVAVALGYFVGGEALGARTVVGTMLVLFSVVLIMRMREKKPIPRSEAERVSVR